MTMHDAPSDTIVAADARESGQDIVCPACGARHATVFHAVDGVPTNSCILLDTRDEALAYPTGDIRLAHCGTCGYIFNAAFDLAKTEYSGRYEETQAFSGTFSTFHTALAERLIARHDLHDKDVLEIGCGKGEFLMLLAELGNNRGVGIDPGVHIERITGPAADRMKFIPDFYSEKYADHNVDFLACKMTLEHIPDAENFMATVRRGLGDQTGAVVFFQIPEAMRILRDVAFEDIYYEHCAYFTPGSLARLFRRTGFDVLSLEIEYDGQYLTIEARPRAGGAPVAPADPSEDDLAEVRALVASFPQRYQETLAGWRARIAEARAAGRTVVLWGSGSKAVSFLTTLGLGDEVAAVTDINPNRHHHFMPTTGHKIVPPQELGAIQPDMVIVMNRIYEQEIRNDLAAIGVSPDVVCL